MCGLHVLPIIYVLFISYFQHKQVHVRQQVMVVILLSQQLHLKVNFVCFRFDGGFVNALKEYAENDVLKDMGCTATGQEPTYLHNLLSHQAEKLNRYMPKGKNVTIFKLHVCDALASRE